jgi:Zn-dependent protease with chaperone function
VSSAAIGVLLALAAVGFGAAIGWTLTACLRPIAEGVRWPARPRATFIAQIRLLPLATTVLLVIAQMLAFARFEERRSESVGPLLLVLATLGLALVVEATGRGLRCLRSTARVLAEWRASALPLPLCHWRGRAWSLHVRFPVIAVVGAIRPQLFVARQVMAHCTANEMAAILAHERAHVTARDNLMQLLFALTPGSRLVPHLAGALEASWRAAVEEAADDHAGQTTSPLELASALTRVARLATPMTPAAGAASAFIGETDLDTRVRRLIEAPSSPRRVDATWLPALLLLVVAVALQLPAAAALVHELFELLVRQH